MKRYLGLMLLGVVCLLPHTTYGAGIRVASEVVTQTTDTFADNQYLVGGHVDARGTAEQDIFIAGGTTLMTGTSTQDVLMVSGQQATLSGVVAGDARVLGGTVTVDGTVQGDLVLIGGRVNVTKSARITGEVLIIGGDVHIDAELTKHARIIGASVSIGGAVRASANITTQRLVLTDTAQVTGSIVYFAPQEVIRQDGAVVDGSVSFNKINSIRENGIIEHAIVSFLNFWIVLRFVTTLLLTFLLVFIFRVFTQKTVEHTLHSFGTSVLIGALTGLLMPIIGVIFLASLILMPVAFLLGLAYVFIGIIASPIAGVAVGVLVQKLFTKQDALVVSFRASVIGVILITLLQFVPFIGELTRFVLYVAAIGAIWRYVYESIRWRKILLFEQK